MVVIFIMVFGLGSRFIGPNERALVFHSGRYMGIARSRYMWIIPIITKVIKIDISDHNWNNKLWEIKDKFSLDSETFKKIEKQLEKDAAEIRKAMKS